MTFKDTLINGFNTLISRTGKQIRIRYFTEVFDNVYDCGSYLTISGTDIWTSGIIVPLNSSADSLLLEQGKLINGDMKLYVTGSLIFTGSNLQIRVGTGSPSSNEYSIISDGTQIWEAQNTKIYKKAYLRFITTGSLIGE